MIRLIWMVLLALLLFFGGLMMISNFQFQHSNFVLGLLAVAAGVFVALDAFKGPA